MGKFKLLFQIDKLAINISGLCISFFRFPMYYKYRKVIERNKKLKENRKSDKCYICGLGPSLKLLDLEKLDGDTIVVNRFNLYDKEKKIKPTYYCIIDNGFMKSDNIGELIDAINFYKDTIYFLNSAYFEILNTEFKNNSNLYYSCNWKGLLKHNDRIDYTKNVPIMGNVVCYAISLALYLGYKEIVLVGCDFNSFASQKSIHCYDEGESRKISLSYELFCYSFVADTHYELEKYARKNAIKIINATPGSLIDAYERDENYISKLI